MNYNLKRFIVSVFVFIWKRDNDSAVDLIFEVEPFLNLRTKREMGEYLQVCYRIDKDKGIRE